MIRAARRKAVTACFDAIGGSLSRGGVRGNGGHWLDAAVGQGKSVVPLGPCSGLLIVFALDRPRHDAVITSPKAIGLAPGEKIIGE